jgi:MFS transporter, SP family, solute carrier family 2 (facilitated glucose transporter), member 3
MSSFVPEEQQRLLTSHSSSGTGGDVDGNGANANAGYNSNSNAAAPDACRTVEGKSRIREQQQQQQQRHPYREHDTLRNKMGRSASIGALGGTHSLGTFHLKSISDLPDLRLLTSSHNADATTAATTSLNNNATNVVVRSRSVSMDYSGALDLTPTQMGRQELYIEVPFTAVFGLQKKERDVSQAFANYAAGLDVSQRDYLNEEEKRSKMSRASMIILDELEFEANVVTIPLVFAIVIAAASQFLVGYNTGVLNAPAKFVFPHHTTLSWSLAVSAFAVGGPFGAITAGQFADVRGRRGALLITTYTFLISGLLQTLAWNISVIIIARFIVGFASGFSSVLVPIYLGEMAPPTLRGRLGTVTQFALVVGILVANVLAFPLAKEGETWRLLFAVTPIVAMIQILLAPFLLESPRWLLGRDPKSLKARYIIKRLRGLRYDHEVESEVGYFLLGGDAQQQHQHLTTTTTTTSEGGHPNTTTTTSSASSSQMSILQEMWNQRKIRSLLLASLTLQVAQQFCGINAVFYYSTSFFDGVLDNPLVGTTIVGAVNVAATWAVLFMMDTYGRKTLLLWSSAGMFISCLFIVCSLLGYLNHIIALVAVNSYVAFFEVCTKFRLV